PVPPVPPQAPTTFNPELSNALIEILYADSGGAIDRRLARLAAAHGDTVYAEAIYLLSHLRFDPEEARRHWDKILAHRAAMRRHPRRAVDLRVALVSYFVEVSHKLHNPKVIELKLFEETQASAYRDELTGLDNYRSFREHLGREIRRGARSGQPLSLVMIDIDDFKPFNDRHGHEAGNRALAALAGLLRSSLRKVDVPARYGGEEFALILPSTTKTQAQQVAERARLRVEKHRMKAGAEGPVGLTVSMGIATHPADADEMEELVRRADSALYFAKSRGKNQVHLYGESRRSFQRVQASLEGRLSLVATDSHPFTTLNVSEGGLLLSTQRALPVGALLDVALSLDDGANVVQASGRVIRIEEKPEGKYDAAVRLIDISSRDQALLTKYIQHRLTLAGAAEADSTAA
ncbi:MAG TPA: diguanylate cyclase, partial [Candidatus Polarisedimenticolia bacterium]|nr:diguanylate cyclase [Candidatus Polarisedimenticolia bacterium]